MKEWGKPLPPTTRGSETGGYFFFGGGGGVNVSKIDRHLELLYTYKETNMGVAEVKGNIPFRLTSFTCFLELEMQSVIWHGINW